MVPGKLTGINSSIIKSNGIDAIKSRRLSLSTGTFSLTVPCIKNKRILPKGLCRLKGQNVQCEPL